jgi:uncharacterized alpha-E superfamily protein
VAARFRDYERGAAERFTCDAVASGGASETAGSGQVPTPADVATFLLLDPNFPRSITRIGRYQSLDLVQLALNQVDRKLAQALFHTHGGGQNEQ